eukprot:3781653-Prymnesium_polylepis.1
MVAWPLAFVVGLPPPADVTYAQAKPELAWPALAAHPKPDTRRRLQTAGQGSTINPILCGGTASGTTQGLPDTLGQPGGEAWFSFTAPYTGAATWNSCNSGYD